MKSFVRSGESPTARQSAGQLAYNEIRRLILHGQLRPGTLLGEEDLARRIEVSRTPVREALRALLREGLVTEAPRRQVVVAHISERLIEEVRRLRSFADKLAVEAALAHGLNLAGIDQLRLILVRQRRALRAGDVYEFLDCDDEFHIQLAAATGLDLTADLIRQTAAFARLAAPVRELGIDEVAGAAEDHEALIERLEAAEVDRARKPTSVTQTTSKNEWGYP